MLKIQKASTRKVIIYQMQQGGDVTNVRGVLRGDGDEVEYLSSCDWLCTEGGGGGGGGNIGATVGCC